MSRKLTPEQEVAFQLVEKVEKAWGRGWHFLSEHQREAEVAREIVSMLLGMPRDSSPEVQSLRDMARIAYAEVAES